MEVEQIQIHSKEEYSPMRTTQSSMTEEELSAWQMTVRDLLHLQFVILNVCHENIPNLGQYLKNLTLISSYFRPPL